eukprot:scaffold2572_cov75-Skeletonema_marinoi.AAC.9
MSDEVHATALEGWMRKYPISWNTKACHKKCNPDVSLKMELCDYGRVSEMGTSRVAYMARGVQATILCMLHASNKMAC